MGFQFRYEGECPACHRNMEIEFVGRAMDSISYQCEHCGAEECCEVVGDPDCPEEQRLFAMLTNAKPLPVPSMHSPVQHNGETFLHKDCLSDFAGNLSQPGFWVDLFESETGHRVLKTGGDWTFYGANPPQVIPHDDSAFEPFIESCAADTDVAFAKRTWPFTRPRRQQTAVRERVTEQPEKCCGTQDSDVPW